MPAYWLTYKPHSPTSLRGWPAEELRALVRRFEENPRTTALWRVAAHQAARVGDRVYLFKQGSGPRGIFGVGEIVQSPRLQIDPTDVDAVARHRAEIRFDRLVDPDHEFLVELDAIRELAPEFLIATQSSGIRVPDNLAIELEGLLAPLLRNSLPITGDQADDAAFDPDSIDDERERAIRAIRLRRGQPAFRAALLAAYERRCAISACSVVDVLEAAHITPYLGSLTHHVSNGLLLRADLHTLFDCGLLGINPTTRTVVIADRLKTSSYAKLDGRRIRQPNIAADAPSRRNLEKRYALFAGRLIDRRR